MKNFKKFLASVLAAISAFSTFALSSCAEATNDIGTPPDYSTATGAYDFYGYHAISDGTWQEDDKIVDVGTDYRTVERFQEYKDAGMTIMFMQGVSSKWEDWETSDMKKYMDMAYEAGVEKCIINDERLYWLSARTESFIGEGLDFSTQEEFEAYVADCISDYKDHPAFYGLILRDEPTYKMIPQSAMMYKAIKKADPDIFVKQNLWPLAENVKDLYCANAKEITLEEAYLTYITLWQEGTGADYIQFDSYPIGASGLGTYYIKGLKLVADFCKEKDLEFYVVAQTMAHENKGSPSTKAPEKNEMYWQLNLIQSFGVDRVAYFTYWPKKENSTTGEWFIDGATFVSRNGEKTQLYYDMQTIHKEMQSIAPVLKSFTYNATAYYMTKPMNFPTGYLSDLKSQPLQAVKNVTVDVSELVLVNEMVDSAKGNYMYMIQNILEPRRGAVTDMSVTATVEFDSKYNYVAIWYKGEVRYEKLTDHKYSTKLSAGYAEFLIPYV